MRIRSEESYLHLPPQLVKEKIPITNEIMGSHSTISLICYRFFNDDDDEEEEGGGRL